MVIETERLILRKFTKDDLEILAPILADPEVMRFSVNGPLSKIQVAEVLQKRFIDHYAQRGFSLYATIHKKDHNLIGGIGLLTQQIDGEEKIELGYRLALEYWGKGLATEASLAVCQHAFNQLKLNEIISIIDPRNTRSLNVAKRVGMSYLKQTTFHNINAHIYSLNR